MKPDFGITQDGSGVGRASWQVLSDAWGHEFKGFDSCGAMYVTYELKENVCKHQWVWEVEKSQ